MGLRDGCGRKACMADYDVNNTVAWERLWVVVVELRE
jgi:hypothetical protein